MWRPIKHIGIAAGDLPWIGFLLFCAFVGWYVATSPSREEAMVGYFVVFPIVLVCAGVGAYSRIRKANNPETKAARSDASNANSRTVRWALVAIGVAAGLIKLWNIGHH